VGQDRHEEARLRVLAEGLFDEELLRPLDVEAHRPHVDARTRDHEPIVLLNRLELEDAAARQPRERDVLRELRVRPRRRSDGRRTAVTVESHGQVEARKSTEDVADRKVVEPSGGKLLRCAAHQDRERERAERAHAIRSQTRTACSRARAWMRAPSTRVDLRPSTIASPFTTTSRTWRVPRPKRTCPARFAAVSGVGGSYSRTIQSPGRGPTAASARRWLFARRETASIPPSGPYAFRAHRCATRASVKRSPSMPSVPRATREPRVLTSAYPTAFWRLL